MFNPVNLKTQLIRERESGQSILDSVEEILSQAKLQDEEVIQRIYEERGQSQPAELLDEEDARNLFGIHEIRTICIRYRLRFLDSRHFRPELPYEAVSKVKALEKKYGVTFAKFKILAPDKVFDLQEVNTDPMLFAQLNDNKYLLIHQWGKDLSWFRKWLYYPVRSIYTYFNSVAVLAVLVAFSFPFEWLCVERSQELGFRLWLSVHSFIALFFFILFLASTSRKRFTEDAWNSKYFSE